MPTLNFDRNGALPIIDVTVRYHPLKGLAHPSGTVPRITARALIDTGATHVVMQPPLVATLGLPFAANMDNTVVGGVTHTVPGHAADLVFGSGPSFTVTDVLIISQPLQGYDLLVGWDALRFMDWSFKRDGSFSLSW